MKLDIARAWKDEAYRQSLSSEELAQLPENPAGELELSEAELDTVQGGRGGRLNTGLFGTCINSQVCQSFQGGCQSSGAGGCASFTGSACASFNVGSCFSNQAFGSCNSAQGLCVSGGGCFNNNQFGG